MRNTFERIFKYAGSGALWPCLLQQQFQMACIELGMGMGTPHSIHIDIGIGNASIQQQYDWFGSLSSVGRLVGRLSISHSSRGPFYSPRSIISFSFASISEWHSSSLPQPFFFLAHSKYI